VLQFLALTATVSQVNDACTSPDERDGIQPKSKPIDDAGHADTAARGDYWTASAKTTNRSSSPH
jgi:hypothetical protein